MTALLLLLLLNTLQSTAREAIWIEGEDAGKTTVVRHGWYHGVERDLLSGNDWLSHYSKRGPGEAAWDFAISEGGTYDIWLRTNPVRAKQDYSLDGGAWIPMRFDDVRERQNLVDAIDHRFICWIKAGRHKLQPGSHTLRIRIRGELQNSGGVDCLALVNFPWSPTGIAKPPLDEEAAKEIKRDTWFPIYPDDDPFSPESITDMSHLLHKPAGRYGFLKCDGKDFVLEQKPRQPVKFWGMVAGMTKAADLREQQARLYAKHGVNMVRQHPVQSVVGVLRTRPDGCRSLDPDKLDTWDRWFAALKKQGIYMTWSCFYPHVITPDDGYPRELYSELPSRGAGKSSSGMVNFMRDLQDAEWEWIKTILTHRNPHTGLRYLDDPALAIIEAHNEDCVFWHAPLNDLAAPKPKCPRHAAALKRMWMEWIKARYGTDASLRAVWGDGMRQGDSVDNPNMPIYGAWEMQSRGREVNGRLYTGERKRMGDFIRFLAETQRSYYERRYRRLRELGYKGAIVSTAWRAGGPAADPANLWCDDAMDLITRHNYFGGGAGGHGIKEGEVNNDTHMVQPGSHLLSSGFYQVEDKPFIVTEWTQKPPNQWKAEAAPLFAFYNLGLQGWDASYHFAGSRPRMGGGWPNMRSYVSETPHYLGQFPALAFATYRSHIREAPLAAARRLKLNEVFQGIDALSQDFTGGGYDNKELKGSLATPREVLAIGRVTVKIADGLPLSEKIDWSRYWDRNRKTVKSMTGELTWDYGRRVVTLHAPRTQAIIGFAGGGTYDLPGVRASVETPFVSLIFTPLDDQPLASSRHVLITAMARDKQTGTVYGAAGTQLLRTGTPPLLLEPVQATITFKGTTPQTVKVVDIYGVPTKRQVSTRGNTFEISGIYQTYYYEMKR